MDVEAARKRLQFSMTMANVPRMPGDERTELLLAVVAEMERRGTLEIFRKTLDKDLRKQLKIALGEPATEDA